MPAEQHAPTGDGGRQNPRRVRAPADVPILGPQNAPRERQNPDLLNPPSTDGGVVPNLRFSFADAHVRTSSAGWAREVTERELPAARSMAGVNMRLTPGGIRELHWHLQVEFGYVLAGSCRITAVDTDGRTFVDDVEQGDVWFFPKAIPHSIQGLTDGCEFLLVFDDGAFSEYNTFLLTDLIGHLPLDVLENNFGRPASDFSRIPKEELYIFQGEVPGLLSDDRIAGGGGEVPHSFSHRFAAEVPEEFPGGTVRTVHSGNFQVMNNVAAGLVTVNPGAMREIHWHTTNDEWQYYLEGQGRMTVFMANGLARTFDFQAGDVGYVPFACAHYVENTGDAPLAFLEVFKADRMADMSLHQWLALTPPQLVQAHLNTSDEFIGSLRKKKWEVVNKIV